MKKFNKWYKHNKVNEECEDETEIKYIASWLFADFLADELGKDIKITK